MGKLRNIIQTINGEIVDFQRKNKRKIGKNIFKAPSSVKQRLEDDADERQKKIVQLLESDPAHVELLRKFGIRLFRKAQAGNITERFMQTADIKDTMLTGYIDRVTSGDPECIFQIFKMFAIGKDRTDLHCDFEIEYAKAKSIRSRGEERVSELCRSIGELNEIFYKHYRAMIFDCRRLEMGKSFEELRNSTKKKARLSAADIEALESQNLINEDIRWIRNAIDHRDRKYRLKGNYVEIPVEGKKSRNFTPSDLMAVLEHMRDRESDVWNLFSASRFSMTMMANYLDYAIPEIIAALEYRRN